MFPSILIVDDEPSILQTLSGLLADEGPVGVLGGAVGDAAVGTLGIERDFALVVLCPAVLPVRTRHRASCTFTAIRTTVKPAMPIASSWQGGGWSFLKSMPSDGEIPGTRGSRTILTLILLLAARDPWNTYCLYPLWMPTGSG